MQDGLVGNGTCSQARQLQFVSQNSHNRRELTDYYELSSNLICAVARVAYTHVYTLHTYAHMHTH